MEALKSSPMENALTDRDVRRYGRQLVLPEVGWDGQDRLKKARVLVVGAGGLGSPAVLYLAAAGVGCIGLADGDTVDESNLQRQILYDTAAIGRAKARAARDRVRALNPLIHVETYETPITSANATEIIGDFDAVVDCSDNFPTRYLVNDACVFLGKPDVFGAVHRFEGQASVFGAGNGPCYRCFFAEPPGRGVPTCAEAGILGILPGIVGCIQATEILKLLLGGGGTLSGRLLLIDAWAMRFREVAIRKDPDCPVCGNNPEIPGLTGYETFCGVRKDVDTDEIRSIGARELRRLMDREPRLRIVEIREPHETEIAFLPNRLVMPLHDVVNRRNEFDPEFLWVFVCKFGIRSESAIRLLMETGFRGQACTLRDGLFDWIREFGSPIAGGGA